jgi:hypothetical protein
MKVSWDDYSQCIMENKNHVPNHQPDLTSFNETLTFHCGNPLMPQEGLAFLAL